jgi:hypothetical protein
MVIEPFLDISLDVAAGDRVEITGPARAFPRSGVDRRNWASEPASRASPPSSTCAAWYLANASRS